MAGKTWKFAVAAGGAQFYNVIVDDSTPAWVYGSIQDIGSRRGKLDLSPGRDKIPAVDWKSAPGGEGSHQAIDPTNPNIVYSHGFYGNFTRDDLSIPPPTGPARRRSGAAIPRSRRRRPDRSASTPIRPKDDDLRAQWMAPIIVSPHDPKTVYVGFQFVFRSTNRGDAWEKISDDLTDNDPAQMLPKSSNEIPYQTITALAESPRVKGLLYAGTDDGRLHVTADARQDLDGPVVTGAVEEVVFARRAVAARRQTRLRDAARPRRRRLCGVRLQVHRRRQDVHEHRHNMPAGPVNVIREDPTNPNVLYLGTDFGAFVSTDGGKRWQVLGGNLPSVQVSDLRYQPRDK